MKTPLCLSVLLYVILGLPAQTIIPGGPVSGTWTLEGSPYLVDGETFILDGMTLTIEPGVVVEWQDNYSMEVMGRILAVGSPEDSIQFTAADPETGFGSIRFLFTPMDNDTSEFRWCIFRNGHVSGPFPDNSGGAIAMREFGKVKIQQCLFENNTAFGNTTPNAGGGAIALWESSPVIRENRFLNNGSVVGGAISCYMGSNPRIVKNYFEGNYTTNDEGWGKGFGGAILCYIESDPSIDSNIFCNNNAGFYGGAISCVNTCDLQISHNILYMNTAGRDGGAIDVLDQCEPKIINNTLVVNEAGERGGGISISADCSPEIKNTIFWENEAILGNQVYIYDITCYPRFEYNDIQGGQEDFGGEKTSCEYLDNIDDDPLFEDHDAFDYHLTGNSPCIDAGDPNLEDEDGTKSDMGAHCFDQRPVTAIDASWITDTTFVANWEEMEGATGYLLDVSTNENFETFFEGYHNLELGTTDSCHVSGLTAMTSYYYRVRADYYFARSDYSNTVSVMTLTAVKEQASPVFSARAFPNPFDNSITIEFEMKENAVVSLELYDATGRMVMRPHDLEQGKGMHQVNLNTTMLNDGFYLLKFQAGKEHVALCILKW